MSSQIQVLRAENTQASQLKIYSLSLLNEDAVPLKVKSVGRDNIAKSRQTLIKARYLPSSSKAGKQKSHQEIYSAIEEKST